jgi:hypothetical protein
MEIQSVIRMTPCSLVLLLALSTSAHGQRPEANARLLRLFNTDVFNKAPDTPQAFLETRQADLIDPISVMVDLKEGKFYAATIRYPKDIGFDGARKAIDRKYRKWTVPAFANSKAMGLWRNEDAQFAIQMVVDAEQDCISVLYVTFQPLDFVRQKMREAGVLKCDSQQSNVIPENVTEPSIEPKPTAASN